MTRTGRPPAAGVTRRERIEIRASEAERAELEAAARDAGQTLSDWLRQVGLAAARRLA